MRPAEAGRAPVYFYIQPIKGIFDNSRRYVITRFTFLQGVHVNQSIAGGGNDGDIYQRQ